jgi:hypothetical protein
MRRAEKLGLLATDDEVERRITEVKAPYTNEEFDAWLKERQITVDDFKREIRRQLTMTILEQGSHRRSAFDQTSTIITKRIPRI